MVSTEVIDVQNTSEINSPEHFSIKKVAVVGAGVMGTGIAAHIANAGYQTLLLDLTDELAERGVETQKKVKGFMLPEYAERIECGNLSEDFDKLSEVDWIIEAIVENVDIKQDLYRRIDAIRSPHTIVSSNTSTIPAATLLQTVSEDFKSHFLITHFFNPPRFMHLVELVIGTTTLPSVAQAATDFIDIELGKVVVLCNDTPGFIANRIGNYWIAVGIENAIKAGLDVEEVDQIIGKPFGIPKTSIFGLADLVGIDLFPKVVETLQDKLEQDPLHEIEAKNPLILKMIERGQLGRKAGKGFYKRDKANGTFEVIDLTTGKYRPLKNENYSWHSVKPDQLRSLMEHESKGANYAASVMLKVLRYAADLIPEIASSPKDVDAAMRFGYSWKKGPFELIDSLGPDWVAAALEKRNMAVPDYLKRSIESGGFYHKKNNVQECLLPDSSMQRISPPKGVLILQDLQEQGQLLKRTERSCLYDMRDDVVCLELKTKLNTIDPGLLEDIDRALEVVEKEFQGLVITGHQNYFSAGLNLNELSNLLKDDNPSENLRTLKHGQQVFNRVKNSRFPVVGAASGFALGGGCELLMHCDAVQAHAELNTGLVESKVGVIPGWGGCKELILRLSNEADDEKAWQTIFKKVIDILLDAKVSSCAMHARQLGFLRNSDQITMNLDRLLADAKQTVISLGKNYQTRVQGTLRLNIDDIGKCREFLTTFHEQEELTPHEKRMAKAICNILSDCFLTEFGVTEIEINEFERREFLKLITNDAVSERISHMLTTGKALRN